MVLRYPADAAILVAGIPGAGKSTLLARAADPAVAVVLDTDPRRERWAGRIPLPYRLWRPLLHAVHYAAAWRALRRPGPVVVAEPGTRPRLRRAFVRAARAGGHSVHFAGIDVSAHDARDGQHRRRRTIGDGSLARHASRWAETRHAVRAEGFDTIRLLTRTDAGRTERFAFGALDRPDVRRERHAVARQAAADPQAQRLVG